MASHCCGAAAVSSFQHGVAHRCSIHQEMPSTASASPNSFSRTARTCFQMQQLSLPKMSSFSAAVNRRGGRRGVAMAATKQEVTREERGVKVKGEGKAASSGAASGKKKKGPAEREPSKRGFGAKPQAKSNAAPDASVLLRRSEALYPKLLSEHWQEGRLREFVICVRNKDHASNSGHVSLRDWLPVAELGLVSDLEAASALPTALSFLCREVAACAQLSVSPLQRHLLEYSYEGLESFYDHVLGSMTGSQGSGGGQLAADECPYQLLGLQRNAPPSEVRSAYRSLAAAHHPDRHHGVEKEAAEKKFKTVTEAYDRIKRKGVALVGSAPSGSYASLGGSSRSGLSDPIQVKGRSNEEKLPEGIIAAIRPIDLDIVNLFVAKASQRVRVSNL